MASDAGTATAPPARTSIAGGVSIITVAKLWFVLSGYVMYFGLTRMLGPEKFGLYAVVISVVSVINNVLITASLQTVSRFVARDADRSGAVLRQGLRIQIIVGLIILAALELSAGAIGRFLRDPGIVMPLRIVSLMVFAYALYAANVGFLNGRRRFTRQASLDMIYSTLKASLILGAVALGLGVTGAVTGFVVAAFLVLGISVLLVRREPRPGGAFDPREYLGFGGWLVALTLGANLVLYTDLWIVKRMASPDVANVQAGLYRAALTLSQLLYQLLIPLTLVVFPNLACLGQSPDPAAARAIFRGALRYLAVTLIPGAVLLGIMGGDLVALLYGEPYREGGTWLVWLAPAYALWTAAYLIATALCGAGRPREGVSILAIALAAQAACGAVLYPATGPPGAGMGDLLGMGLGLAVGLGLAIRHFGDIVPWSSIARGVLLAAGLGAAALAWPATGPALLVKLAVLGAAGLALLFVTGEIRLPARGAKA